MTKLNRVIVLILIIIYGLFFTTTAYARGHNRDEQRKLSLQRVFKSYSSPLAGSAGDFIKIAKKYKLDWKLLPAIAGVESGFETAGNTADHNPFGYMCGDNPCVFGSYRQAALQVAKTISRGGAYQEFRATKSIYALALVYNQVQPEEWTQKIEYFEALMQ